MASEPSPLARALGRIPSGLYVVTTSAGDQPMGFVGSLVMQVGFEPPTVCVAVAKGRDHLEAMRASGRFALSVLDGQSSGLMSPFFAKRAPGESPFEGLRVATTPGGSTILSEALAWIDCELSGEHDTGDHIVVFGTVVDGSLLREGDPKVHLRKSGLDY